MLYREKNSNEISLLCCHDATEENTYSCYIVLWDFAEGGRLTAWGTEQLATRQFWADDGVVVKVKGPGGLSPLLPFEPPAIVWAPWLNL